MIKSKGGHSDHSAMAIPYVPFLVTASDTEDFKDATGRPTAARGISFVTAGVLVVVLADDTTVTIPDGALGAGVIHAIRCKRINATGTTAVGIVGYY